MNVSIAMTQRLIRVFAVGQTLIEVGRRTFRPDAEMVFATVLILAAERGRRVERESIANLLWAGESVSKRRHNLRQVLYKLRGAGVEFGDASGPLMLSRDDVWLDFEDVDRSQADQSSNLDAISSMRFMPGFAPRFSDEFSAWLDSLRERAEGQLRLRLVEAISACRREGRWEHVERLARECLQLDPLNEEAHLALAESVALSGGKSKAVAMLDAYIAEVPEANGLRLQAGVLRKRIADRLVGRIEGPLETRLTGREDLLQPLTDAIERSKQAQPSAQVLWGAAGIGKTRILEEAARVATLLGARVFSHQAEPDDAHTPGLSLVRLFRGLSEAPGVLGLAPDVLSLLQHLTAQPTLGNAARSQFLGEETLLRLLVDLERAIAYETLLVIVMDDLHHADALSLRVLRKAQACLSTDRVLFLAATIPHPERIGWSTPVPVHEVGRLTPTATIGLARGFIEEAGGSADASTVEILALASGGNPFVLRETVLAWLRDPIGRERPSFERALKGRVRSLSRSVREVLFTTLILGEHATVSLIMSCAALSPPDVESALVELEAEQICKVSPDGGIRAHSIWFSTIDELVPNALAVSRRHRIAQILEHASSEIPGAAELLLASATHFERSGDRTRAASVLARGGDALRDRALAPGAYAAYTRAAELAPSSDNYDRCLFLSLLAAHQAQLPHDVLSLLTRSGHRVRTSSKLSHEQRSEADVIDIEARRLLFHNSGQLSDRCCRLLAQGDLTPRQKLRVALAGARVAEHESDVDAIATIKFASELVVPESEYDEHLSRQIGIVCAVADRRLEDATRLALKDMSSIDETWPLHERCHSLLHARVPFQFDCDFAQVERIVSSARDSVRAYPTTFLALRVEDMYATLCIELMRFDAAKDAVARAIEISAALDSSGGHNDLRETKLRYAVAADRAAFSRTEWDEILEPLLLIAPGRLRTLVLCDACIGLSRSATLSPLARVVGEIERDWERIKRLCPFDYPVVALAVGLSTLGQRSEGLSVFAEYMKGGRPARNPPSAYMTSLIDEFDLLA